MNSLAIAFTIGSANGFILALLVARGSTNVTANRLLAALLTAVSCRVAIYALGFAGFYDAHPWLTFAPLDYSAGFAPLLFLYAQAITRELHGEWGWHLAPAAVQLGYNLICFALPMPLKWSWYVGIHLHAIEPWSTTVIAALACLYLIASWRTYRKYERSADQRRTNARNRPPSLRWLGVSICSFALVLAVVISAILRSLLYEPLGYNGRVPVLLAFAILAYGLGLLGWRYGETEIPPLPSQNEAGSHARVHHTAKAAEWRRRVEAAEWWRDEDLSLSSLALRLGVSERTLSRGLRQGRGQNFNAFINQLRVQGVQRTIASGSNQDLLTIALDCGFASKASFNRAFLTHAGLSPSAWRAANRQAQDSPTLAAVGN